jgi:pyruvate/2-oxoglutarate dehydrogenase complex dihydrolipoamide acyltransferase (E2) component
MSGVPEPSAGVPVLLPDLGADSVRLSVWFADPGDRVYEGDRLVEVRLGGATFDVPAPATGRLAERRAFPNDRLAPRQVLGIVTPDADE